MDERLLQKHAGEDGRLVSAISSENVSLKFVFPHTSLRQGRYERACDGCFGDCDNICMCLLAANGAQHNKQTNGANAMQAK